MYWYDHLLTEFLDVHQRILPDKTNTFVAKYSFALRNKCHHFFPHNYPQYSWQKTEYVEREVLWEFFFNHVCFYSE